MTHEELLARISIDRNICGGMACIRGTRIPVAVVLGALSGGDSEAEILDAYPSLKQEDIRAALAYAHDLAQEMIWKVAG